MSALQFSFYIGAALSFAAAVAPLPRGQKCIHEVEQAKEMAKKMEEIPVPLIRKVGLEDGDSRPHVDPQRSNLEADPPQKIVPISNGSVASLIAKPKEEDGEER